MKMLLTVEFPHEPFNSLVRSGRAGELIGHILETIKPEAAYFTEQPGGGGAGGGEADDKDFGLSKDQVAAAKRMNMTPKEFRENLDYTMNSYGHTKGAAHVN